MRVFHAVAPSALGEERSNVEGVSNVDVVPFFAASWGAKWRDGLDGDGWRDGMSSTAVGDPVPLGSLEEFACGETTFEDPCEPKISHSAGGKDPAVGNTFPAVGLNHQKRKRGGKCFS